MRENGFPNSELELVQKIDNEHFGWVKPRSKTLSEHILQKNENPQKFSDKKIMMLTWVGTPENSLSSPSTPAPVIGFAKLYISCRAAVTLLAKYCRKLFSRTVMSCARPSLSSLDFSTRHRGHGAKALSRIVANRTLGCRQVN